MSAKDLRPTSDGRFYAVCGKCLASSDFVPAVDADAAWVAFVSAGWSTNAGGWPYPVCPKCTANPRTLEERVKSAHKSRKRK
jgi:hypothetical protein